jgi:hypothetical protein
MARTKEADAMQILKENKLLLLTNGPGTLWNFKRPLDEIVCFVEAANDNTLR